MTNNKLTTYYSNIQQLLHDKGALLSIKERQDLEEIQHFLSNLNHLTSPVQVRINEQPATPFIQQAIAHEAAQIQAGPVAPVPNGAAPAAMKLSSLTKPQVDGCIAAMPSEVKQQAAQAELDRLLAEQKAQADLEASLRQQMEAKQLSVEESLRKQLEEQKAAAAAQAPAPQQQMTLAEFEAMHAKKDTDDKQALLDAMLAQQQTAPVASPEIQP